ncbi:DEAD/DEAH box helicase [Streptomyces sp. NPDC047022]|uniref:DEAD/DEAH box helicase n=1 Tax=Streptomyces sp. NPDC047022 TaxID=3155737 RepID=UPI0033DBCD3A
MEDNKQPVRFRRQVKQVTAPPSPEALFGVLPRTTTSHGALWSHQADMLRAYADPALVKKPDVALELPTGSGKTLVGLLLADWRRRHFKHRSVYACPTNQLAHQVWVAARAQGVPAALFTGGRPSFSDQDLGRYEGAEVVAITIYSHVFNTNPAFGNAQSLLFDDAHAAESFVAEAWAIEIPATAGQFTALLDVFGDDLDPHLVTRLTDRYGGTEVRLLPVPTVAKHAAELDMVLSTLTGNAWHRFKMVRSQLRACLFYVSPQGWYIRPLIPPTFAHEPFTVPQQRIYLSATLGEGGELERAFGRPKITRIPAPPEWENIGSGRRFFVFPDLAESTDDPFGPGGLHVVDTNQPAPQPGTAEAPADPEIRGGLVGRLIDLRGKSVVLTPDRKSATLIADTLGVPHTERFRPGDTVDGLQLFKDADRGMLLAPSRFDGMDLPDEACSVILMHNLPDALHLQDRFLQTALRAGRVALERVRTRVIQGAGRCTRGPRDFALVIVTGRELQRFLARLDVREGLPPELQAEIAFGRDNSQVTPSQLVGLARSALNRDQIWQEDAEPDIVERRSECTKQDPAYVDKLAASAEHEVKAWQAAWLEDWDAASRCAVQVLDLLTGEELRPYQALWAYLGSVWARLAVGAPGAPARAEQLLERARKAAVGTWLREIEGHVDAEPELGVLDGEAVAAVAQIYRSSPKLKTAAKFRAFANEMLANLGNPDSTMYEQGLASLGELLGARSFKPPGQGRTDAAWLWPSWWMTVEAKSEQKSEGGISLKYIRQTNTQLRQLAADEGLDEPPADSISVIASPRGMVSDLAVPAADKHLYLVSPEAILAIAVRAMKAWTEIRSAAPAGVEGEDLLAVVAQALRTNVVLPSYVKDAVTADPVRP